MLPSTWPILNLRADGPSPSMPPASPRLRSCTARRLFYSARLKILEWLSQATWVTLSKRCDRQLFGGIRIAQLLSAHHIATTPLHSTCCARYCIFVPVPHSTQPSDFCSCHCHCYCGLFRAPASLNNSITADSAENWWWDGMALVQRWLTRRRAKLWALRQHVTLWSIRDLSDAHNSAEQLML